MQFLMQVRVRPDFHRDPGPLWRGWVPGLVCALVAGGVQAQGEPARHAVFDTRMLVRGAGADNVDLSRFERPNAVVPGKYNIDVHVNGKWSGTTFVEFREAGPNGAMPCYTADLLRGVGLDLDKLQSLAAEQGRTLPADAPLCGDIAEYIPGAQARFDTSEQRLMLTVPTIYLQSRFATNYVDPSQWDSGIPAARLGYVANYYGQTAGAQHYSRAYVGLNAGVNAGKWRLRHEGALTWTSRQNAAYQRGKLYATTAVPALRSQVTVGETVTDGRYFSPVSFRGVRVNSDERMLPDDRVGYVPVVRGTAQTNATVSVYQRGFLVHETTVPPGPFAIENLQAASYGGDLEVRVTEANGQTRSFMVPFSTMVDLLRPGQTRYTVSAGQAMTAGYRSAQQSLFEAVVRHGVSDLVTAYGGAAASSYYGSLLAGAALNTRVGAFSGDATVARASLPGGRLTGSSYRVAYAKSLLESGTDFSILAHRYSTSGFVGLGEVVAARDGSYRGSFNRLGRARNRLDVNINQNLGDKGGSFYVGGSATQYWGQSGNVVDLSAGYRNNVGKVAYGLNVQRTAAMRGALAGYERNDTLVTFNMSVPLGSSASNAPMLSSYLSHSAASGTQTSAGVGGALGEDRRLSYSLSVSRNSRSDASAASGSLDYRAVAADLGMSLSQGAGYRQFGLRATGSVLGHQGGITLAPMLGETVGLLYAPDAKDARITRNQTRIDDWGYGLVPFLTPYRRNTVELDPRDMPDDVELLSSSRSVAPSSGAVVLLSYPTRRARPVLISGSRPGGIPLPFGAEVFDAEGTSVGAVGQGSRIVMRVADEQGSVSVRWGPGPDERCRIDYELPAREARQRDGFDTLESVCMPEPEPTGKFPPTASLKQ